MEGAWGDMTGLEGGKGREGLGERSQGYNTMVLKQCSR